jgi:M6 family metalloprotease-like protein
MTKALRISAIFLFTYLFPFLLKAASNNGDTIQLRQPDKSWVNVVVWGDEWYQHIESTDGYTLIRDPQTNWICYAQLNETKNDLISTGVVYHGQQFSQNFFVREIQDEQKNTLGSLSKSIRLPGNIAKQKRASTIKELYKNNQISDPDAGKFSGETDRVGHTTVVGLSILVDFSDEPATIPVSEMTDLLNKPGYKKYSNNGSVRDYFLDVSAGKLDYSNIVIGYYRAKKPKSYYDDNSLKARVPELLDEVYSWANDSVNFDFSSLSLRFNKYIIAVSIFYAGVPEAGWSKGLWPHHFIYDRFNVNGIYSGSYQLSYIGSDPGIGTFCHESGHMLYNWPDLYDYGYDNFLSTGIGYYCLMGKGSFAKNPIPPNAWLRAQVGWDSVMTMDTSNAYFYNSKVATFKHICNSNTSYKYANPDNPGESFFIEGRRQIGRNKLLPDYGLMIWHVDEKMSYFHNNEYQQMLPDSHYMISLLQADNLKELERGINYGNRGDLYGYEGRRAYVCGDNTSPSTDWWNGANSNLEITYISGVSSNVRFNVSINNTRSSSEISETDKNRLSVFPNPTQGEFMITLEEAEPAVAYLFDLTGKLVYTAALNNLSNTVDISGLENGAYVMKIIAEKHTSHFKLMKQ